MIADSGKATRYKFNLTNNLYLKHLKEIFFYLKAFTRTKPTKWLYLWLAWAIWALRLIDKEKIECQINFWNPCTLHSSASYYVILAIVHYSVPIISYLQKKDCIIL